MNQTALTLHEQGHIAIEWALERSRLLKIRDRLVGSVTEFDYPIDASPKEKDRYG